MEARMKSLDEISCSGGNVHASKAQAHAKDIFFE
jgi:hypothetical protein